jgi:hypothetical protein
LAGGGLVGITHAESNATETNSGQAQTFTEVTNADQQGNVDDSQVIDMEYDIIRSPVNVTFLCPIEAGISNNE